MHPKKLTILLISTILLAPCAMAHPEYLVSAVTKYPNIASTPLANCTLCHVYIPAPGVPATRNPYGLAWKNANYNFSSIEGDDSDMDGFTNITEINALSFPGDPSSTPAPAGSITVKKPRRGQVWIQGTRAKVVWITSGDTGPTVNIDLLKSGVKVKTLKSGVPNDGKQRVKVPKSAAIGSDYKVRVTSTTNAAITDDSNKTFSIAAP